MPKLTNLIRPQAAALPYSWDGGRLRVLMITSRETQRWVIPKGWLMAGKTPWQVAEIEALEEAGVTGTVHGEPIGHYHYKKLLPRGRSCECKVIVYPLLVEKLKTKWKERSERSREWFSPRKAAKRVIEPELTNLFLMIAGNQAAGSADGILQRAS